MRPILASLFPKTVSVAGGRPADASGSLYPEEARLILGAVAERRCEFTAGRHFARQALAGLGRPASPILAHERRPLWPAGTIGTITHAAGRCAAAVALVGDLAGIGLDVEARDAVTTELQRHVLTGPELAWLASLPAAAQNRWATATFSAKEAFYKSLAELDVGFVDFHAVRIGHGSGGAFEVVIDSAALAARLRAFAITGRALVEDDRIWTAVTLRHRP